MSGNIPPGTRVRSNVYPVDLYRVIDLTEWAYLLLHGNYGSNPSRSGKYFALTLHGAFAFASAPMNTRSKVTHITLAPSIIAANGFRMLDRGTLGAGPSIYFDEPLLPLIYSAMTAPGQVIILRRQP